MITRHSPRAHLLVLLCMLSFAAAILAATAYAGQDFYCNGCTLSSSGVPATSGSTNHIANGMQLAVAADWHHYQYNISTGVTHVRGRARMALVRFSPAPVQTPARAAIC